MSYQHVFDPEASKEYKSSINWYLDKSEQAADNFIKEVKSRIGDICGDPTRYKNTHKKLRETALARFPFSIIYVFDENTKTVVITSIYHHKRNPKRKYRD